MDEIKQASAAMTDAPDSAIDPLIEGWFEDTLTADQCIALVQQLRSSPAYQQRFRHYAEEQAALMAVTQRCAMMESVNAGLETAGLEKAGLDDAPSQPQPSSWTWQIIPATAAAAAAAVALWLGIPMASNGQQPADNQSVVSATQELPMAPKELRLRLTVDQGDVQVMHDLSQKRRITVQVSPSHRR